ncbi:MAG: hypothetical protein LQ347_001756 [Umbilicaria vellea]|nr:MAG: hypothetical protein LQ347_001756 [Umbilicaria vellea]
MFNEAFTVFKSELSKDPTKWQWIVNSKAGSLPEVLASITAAQKQYEARKGNSSARKYLSDLSEKIHYYGNIMDVLVQHHPEYTSLAWGAMKVLFVGVVNHEKLLSRLSQGLCQVADALPRLELTARLYPTERVKRALVAMYAHILKFLVRSLRWYQETRLSRAIHSITRPAELRYDDLLEKISYLSRNVTDLALTSSQAEQRDMHIQQQQFISKQLASHTDLQSELQRHGSEHQAMQTKIDGLSTLVLKLSESFATNQTLNSSAQITLRQSLSETQLSQFLSFISNTSLLDPTTSFQSSLFMRNRRRLRPSSSRGPPFWLTPKIQQWNRSTASSLIMIKGTRKLRFHIKDFCTDSICALRQHTTPTIWALQSVQNGDSITMQAPVSTADLLKSLISQAIRLNPSLHTDASLSPRLNAYLDVSTEAEWFSLLSSVLQDLPLVYILIDVETVHAELEDSHREFSWPMAFLAAFSGMAERGIKTVVKVILVSYGSSVFGRSVGKQCEGLVVPVSDSTHAGRLAMKEQGKKRLVFGRSRKFGLLFDS